MQVDRTRNIPNLSLRRRKLGTHLKTNRSQVALQPELGSVSIDTTSEYTMNFHRFFKRD